MNGFDVMQFCGEGGVALVPIDCILVRSTGSNFSENMHVYSDRIKSAAFARWRAILGGCVASLIASGYYY